MNVKCIPTLLEDEVDVEGVGCFSKNKKKKKIDHEGPEVEKLCQLLTSFGVNISEVMLFIKNPHISLCRVPLHFVHIVNTEFGKKIVYKNETLMYIVSKFLYRGEEYAVKQIIFDQRGFVHGIMLSQVNKLKFKSFGILNWKLMYNETKNEDKVNEQSEIEKHWYSQHVFLF